MPTFSSIASISASPERTWSILGDVVRWPEWLPTVTAVEPLDSPPLRIGARYEVQQPKLRTATWTVTELDPPRLFVWQSRSPGVRVIANHSIESVGDATIVTLQITFSGVLSPIVGLLAGRLTRDYLAQEAASLKRTVESYAPQGGIPPPCSPE